jgi:hypothetical protein
MTSIFVDDRQMLAFLDPAKVDLRFLETPAAYDGDGARFQKFAFEGVGEIDFIAAGPLTKEPFKTYDVEGRAVNLETIPEVITKKVYHRGREAKARDVFDIAAAGREYRNVVVDALRGYPEQVAETRVRLETLNPDFVSRTIGQLMILPDYLDMPPESLELTKSILDEVLAR